MGKEVKRQKVGMLLEGVDREREMIQKQQRL